MENKNVNQEENQKNDLSKEDVEDVVAGETSTGGLLFPCYGPGR